MKNIFQLIFLVCLCVSCNDRHNSDHYDDETSQEETSQGNEDYPDGTYCAKVEYYNPNTGTRNDYNLDVEVENGELIQIHWPNGGWLDESHFNAEDISDGQCQFTSDKGYIYTVSIGEQGGCGYTDEIKLRNDVDEDEASITCPECDNEKSSFDEVCDDCKRKKEETCPKCGGHKYSSEDLCEDCMRDNSEDE